MKILVVDDHQLARIGIVSALSYEENIKEIYQAANVNQGLQQLIKHKPDICLIDLNLGQESGLEIVRHGKKKNSNTKFIILTASTKKTDFLLAREIGISGYLLKGALMEDIIYAISVVVRGKEFYDTEVLKYTLQDKERKLNSLTSREKEVLLEIGKGLSNCEISSQLMISEYTVKKHVSNILGKLSMNHRTEAAIYINNIIKS